MNNKTNYLSRPAVAFAVATFCCLLWGSAFPGIKSGYEIFGISSDNVGSQMLFAGIRFALAGIMVIGVTSVKEKKFIRPTKKSFPKVLLMCLFQTALQYFFHYIGLAHTSGVKGSVIVGTNVFTTLIVLCLVFRLEKLTLLKIIGCVIGFLGVLVINMGGEFGGGFSLNGEGAIICATICTAFSSAFMKKFSASESPVMLSGWQFFFGGIILSAVGLIFGGGGFTYSTSGILLLLYLSFVSAAAYTLWALLLKYNPASEISVYGFMNPIFGVILSALFLGETAEAFGYRSLLALLFVCAGIFIVNRSHDKAAV